MAKNLKFSTALKNVMLSSGVGSAFDGGVLELRDGTQPTTADTAPTGNVLVSIPLPTPALAAVASGARAKSGTWVDTSSNATGTATWWRLKTATDTGTTNTTDLRMDGTVGSTAGQFDCVVNTPNIVANKQFSIDVFSISFPNQ